MIRIYVYVFLTGRCRIHSFQIKIYICSNDITQMQSISVYIPVDWKLLQIVLELKPAHEVRHCHLGVLMAYAMVPDASIHRLNVAVLVLAPALHERG